MPKAGIVFPGSEFLQALDDLDTGATFDFAVNLVTLSREMEFVRNDRAKGNIDDQFTQRRDVRNGDAELIATWRQLAEYNRQLEANIDERPLQAAFVIAVGAPDPHTLDYSVKRLREELTQSGQIAIRHYRGAQTRLWAAFNPAAPTHKTTVDQFAQPTTTKKWSRFVPFTSSMVGNSTGILLGFNQKQRTGQRSAARPARRRTPQPQPLPGVQRCPGIRQILCRQTHHPRRNPARHTSIHRRPRHRMAKSPLPTSTTKPSSTWPATTSAATRCAPSRRTKLAATGWTT